MARRGKGLRFSEEEVEDLVETRYDRKGRDFALLALMYPGVDVRNEFHVDHVFPRGRFKPSKLSAAGFTPEQIASLRERMDRLPNLQLLEGSINIAKQDQWPQEWATAAHPDAAQRGLYLAGHDLEGLPGDLGGFDEFYEHRRERMAAKLRTLLGSPGQADTPGVGSDGGQGLDRVQAS